MMKILFVCSGNNNRISPFIKAQGESLANQGIDIKYFLVMKPGITGYIQEAIRLRRFLRDNRIDIIHAHYSLCGWCAVLAFSGIPIVLSLMGDDANGTYKAPGKKTFLSRLLILTSCLIQPFVDRIICKSAYMQRIVFNKKKMAMIPNGIALNDVCLLDKQEQKKRLGLDISIKYVLFLGNTKDVNKNFPLLERAFEFIKSEDIHLLAPYRIEHKQVIQYLNAVDMLVVPSLMEGSPNVVKEAMACNTSVVATDVGDIRWLFGEEKGYYITEHTVESLTAKMKEALGFTEKYGRTNGRKRIMDLELDSASVAKKIISLYKQL